jgi:short-subunit dehydrogenase
LQQIAYQYAKKGAKLVLIARREDRLKAVADKSSSMGAPAVHVIAADVAKEEDCKKFIEETIRIYGRCKIHISNAHFALICEI